jgi:hypothetical protein
MANFPLQFQLPKFDGTSDVATWINSMEAYFAANETDAAHQILVARMFLTGLPQLLHSEEATWDALKTALTANLVAENQSLGMVANFSRVPFSDMPHYVNDFLRQAKGIRSATGTAVPDREAVALFLLNIPPALRHQLMVKVGPLTNPTLTQVIQLAITCSSFAFESPTLSRPTEHMTSQAPYSVPAPYTVPVQSYAPASTMRHPDDMDIDALIANPALAERLRSYFSQSKPRQAHLHYTSGGSDSSRNRSRSRSSSRHRSPQVHFNEHSSQQSSSSREFDRPRSSERRYENNRSSSQDRVFGIPDPYSRSPRRGSNYDSNKYPKRPCTTTRSSGSTVNCFVCNKSGHPWWNCYQLGRAHVQHMRGLSDDSARRAYIHQLFPHLKSSN